MFERLNYLYKAGKLSDLQLDVAVSKGWITGNQKQEILAA